MITFALSILQPYSVYIVVAVTVSLEAHFRAKRVAKCYCRFISCDSKLLARRRKQQTSFYRFRKSGVEFPQRSQSE